MVSLKAHANSKYVDAANSTTSLIADAASIGKAETFEMVTGTDGTVNLKSLNDNQWVTAESDGASPLIANRTAIGPWETFDLIANGNGSVSLRAHADDDYVTTPNSGTSPLIASQASISTSSEQFDLIFD